MAAHPEIKQYAGGIASATVEELNRRIAALVTRLLTDSGANETRAAFKAGPSESFSLAFRGLGELAMQELMADQSVKESMSGFNQYVDQERFEKLRTDQ